MTPHWNNNPVFCFTSDIDWASETTIQYSHEILSEPEIKFTYFNTHPSKYLTELNNLKKIKLLVHPNFLPDSSHGADFGSVIEYCMNLVPDADGFRCHRYFEVNDIMDDLYKKKYKFSSNICTRCEIGIRPFFHRSGLLSIPIFLEDGGYLLMDPELDFKKLIPALSLPGLKVINFHPAHIAFNTPNFGYTRSIKDRLSRESWNNLTFDDIHKIEYQGRGVRSLIKEIIDYALKNKFTVMTLNEIYDEHINSLVILKNK